MLPTLQSYNRPQHLEAGGQAVVIWLWRLLNAVMELLARGCSGCAEEWAHSASIQGWGKDPLKVDSYRRGGGGGGRGGKGVLTRGPACVVPTPDPPPGSQGVSGGPNVEQWER